MKIEFLGTGAAEGIPALFCKCEICEHARNAGGKNIRMRTGILIDRRLLMDFSPDAFVQSLYRKIDYSGLHALLVTHTHSDHFAVDDLVQRSTCNSRNRTVPVLKVLGSRMMCARRWKSAAASLMQKPGKNWMRWSTVPLTPPVTM